MKNKYSPIFAIVAQLNKQGLQITYKEALKGFTGGRTDSLKELTDNEFSSFQAHLQNMIPKEYYPPDKLDALRKGIIAQFRSIGKTAEDAKAWAEKYGVKGKKRGFNEYSGQELWMLLQNAKNVSSDFITSINRRT